MSGSVVGSDYDYQLASGLSVRELKEGDIVVLAPYQHLKLVAQLVPELSVFNDEELLAIGSAHGMVSHLPDCLRRKSPRGSPRTAASSLDDWDGFIDVNIVSKGIEIRVPLAAIDDRVDIDLDDDMDDEDLPNVTPFDADGWSHSDRQYEVDEPLETSMEMRTEYRGTHAYENYSIPQYMAAETIQQAWKNYGRFRDMKESYDNKMQRITSSEKLVMDIAADMIKKNYKQSKAYIKKNKLSKEHIYPRMFPQLDTIPTHGSNVPSSSSLSPKSRREDKESYNSPRSVGRNSHMNDSNAPINPPPQLVISADSKMFIEIIDISCKDLSKVNWDSPNDPFVEFMCAEWTRKTPTRWESGSEANWQHPGILVPIDCIGGESSIYTRVYSANLVREHLLIGQARLTLSDDYFISSSPLLNKKKTFELTLEDITGKTCTGSIIIVGILREGEEYALLEAKLAVENAEKSIKEEEAENYRLELMKKRQEKEAEKSAAAARKKEAKRLSKVQARQEDESTALNVAAPEGKIAENVALPKKSATPSKKKPLPKTTRNKKLSKISIEIPKSDELQPLQESKQDFRFTAAKTKNVVPSRISERKAEAKVVETETLYRDEKAEPKLASGADEYLKKALNEHPKLFEVRGEKKEMASPVKTEAPEVSIPKRQQMSFIDHKVPIKAEDKEVNGDAQQEASVKSVKNILNEDDKDSKFVGNGASSKQQPLLVIDKAFQQAKKAVCSIISLRLSEVIVLLGALDISMVRKDSEVVGSGYDLGDATVGLSLTSASAFAGALTSHVRKYDLIEDSNSFVCSEDVACRAMNNLNVLVEGPWKRTRALILKLCKKTLRKKSCCPSKWSSEAINSLLSLLQVRSGKELANGMEFLELSTVDSLFFYSAAAPSLLKYRLKLYQKLLCHLDDWWDSNPRQRPGDNVLSVPDNGVDSALRGKGSKSKVKVISSAAAPSSSAAARALSDVEDGEYIKICEADELLRNLMSMNRGLGWNMSIDQVTLISSRLAGLKGKVTKSYRELPAVKGCRWILLTPQTSGRPGLAADFRELLDIDILKDLADDLRPTCIAALIPILCLEMLAPENQLMSPKAIKVGQKISIAPLAALRNSVSRFEWYDRPEDTMLAEIAGSLGEVVSIAELNGAGRVGVEFKLPRGSIIEGIPVEALRNGAPKTPAGVKSPQTNRRSDKYSPRSQLADKRLSYFQKGDNNVVNNENYSNGNTDSSVENNDDQIKASRGKGVSTHIDIMLDIGHSARRAISSSISNAIDSHLTSKSPDAKDTSNSWKVSDPSALIDDELIQDLNQYYKVNERAAGSPGSHRSNEELIIEDNNDELQADSDTEEKRDGEYKVEYFVPEVKQPQVIIAAQGTSTASKLYRPTTEDSEEPCDDPIVEAMKNDPRARQGPRTLNNPSGIYVSKLDLPPKKNPSPVRKPLYRPPEREKKQKVITPLKLKSYAWLNPNGDIFDRPESSPTNAAVRPNPPFQSLNEEKEFVPVTKSFGKPPSRKQVRPVPIQEVRVHDATDVSNEDDSVTESSPRIIVPTPSLEEAKPPTLSYQVYNDWGDGLFDDVKPTEDMKRVEERYKSAVSRKSREIKKQNKEVLDADDLDDTLVGVEALSKALFSLQGRGLATR